jgi:hypothetical protein
MGPGRVSIVALFPSEGREPAVFTDDKGVEVARRTARIRVRRHRDERGVLHEEVTGQLSGGRWSAGDIAGRRLHCRAQPIGPDPLPCVVRTSGEIVFLAG